MPASVAGAAQLPPVDVVLSPSERVQPSLPLASEGMQRYLWHSRFGAMLIEVIGGEVFVNGQRVEPHAP